MKLQTSIEPRLSGTLVLPPLANGEPNLAVSFEIFRLNVILEISRKLLLTAGLSAVREEFLNSSPLNPGQAAQWYADIPLNPKGATKIKISHQNGVLEETAEIIWEVTNLLEANDTVIRKGDSLLLNAAPADAKSGTVTIDVNGCKFHPRVPRHQRQGAE